MLFSGTWPCRNSLFKQKQDISGSTNNIRKNIIFSLKRNITTQYFKIFTVVHPALNFEQQKEILEP